MFYSVFLSFYLMPVCLALTQVPMTLRMALNSVVVEDNFELYASAGITGVHYYNQFTGIWVGL